MIGSSGRIHVSLDKVCYVNRVDDVITSVSLYLIHVYNIDIANNITNPTRFTRTFHCLSFNLP